MEDSWLTLFTPNGWFVVSMILFFTFIEQIRKLRKERRGWDIKEERIRRALMTSERERTAHVYADYGNLDPSQRFRLVRIAEAIDRGEVDDVNFAKSQADDATLKVLEEWEKSWKDRLLRPEWP